MSWFTDFNDAVRPMAPLAPLTWYRLGGPARWLVEPRDETDLAAVVRRCADAGVEIRFLGKGANLLVSDEGVDGAVIRLTGPAWEHVEINGGTVFAAAGADLMKLVKHTARLGLRGIEGLAGIPASIGGAVRMNCGGRYGEIGARVKSVRVITPGGQIRDRADVRFHYRSTNLGPYRVVGVTLELTPDDPARVYSDYETVWREKTSSQPALAQRSAGCVFRNPPGEAAGRLIDRCGLKGLRVGGAEVSPIHANFFVAHDHATAADVLMLADEVAQRVEAATGIRLEMEVEVWSRRSAVVPVRPRERSVEAVRQRFSEMREEVAQGTAVAEIGH